MKKRTVALLLALVLVFGVAVGGTIAWLTSQTATVTNSFTAGNVTITLDEAKVDEYGVPVTGAARVTENEYKLINGQTYTKDPTIHVQTGSEDCYVYVTVDNGLAGLDDGTIAAQMTANGWVKLDGVKVGELDVYYLASSAGANDGKLNADGSVSAGKDVVVFESFTISGTANLGSAQDVVIVGYAIQRANMTSAADAWAKGSSNWT